jgi:hypothetical protein
MPTGMEISGDIGKVEAHGLPAKGALCRRLCAVSCRTGECKSERRCKRS